MNLNNNNDNVNFNNNNKGLGFSVRCLKDSENYYCVNLKTLEVKETSKVYVL